MQISFENLHEGNWLSAVQAVAGLDAKVRAAKVVAKGFQKSDAGFFSYEVGIHAKAGVDQAK